MRADRPDANAKDLYANLELAGYSVRRVAKTRKNERGTPDAIVARRGDPRRRNHWLEVKSLGGRLSSEQFAFHVEWPGCTHVGTSSWEVIELLKECEERNGR